MKTVAFVLQASIHRRPVGLVLSPELTGTGRRLPGGERAGVGLLSRQVTDPRAFRFTLFLAGIDSLRSTVSGYLHRSNAMSPW